jgi:hypothetical protein
MGQGYRAIILALQTNQEKEIINTWVDPHAYANGYKIMEHSYVNNNFVEAVEYLISPLGMFNKSRLVWAGDYADEEVGSTDNLYMLTYNNENEKKMSLPSRHDMSSYKYIINHTKKLYINKETSESINNRKVHPLPLLTAEGNGRGGGDYRGQNIEFIGIWARDVISVEKDIPVGYEEFVCRFTRI